ncbi:acyltransferase family protein [Demequina muriae]|uniref:Acyltransferase family protein n=1 Tax=Demequina muriae TaxID=3051664 RepID=A0ABT8GI63_9MICO|nr:acyltransferase family protein [Demequina sp. EGI L300058]MDN4480949.1 acyltransferase family protein [Demequina sp. EGI L300058]
MTSPSTLSPHRPLSPRDDVRTDVASPPERDRSIDAAVGLLVMLVVFSHAIGPLSGRPAEAITQWLFMFHMPAFVFLSGYLTRKSSGWSPRALAGRLLFPFAVFQVLHVVAASLAAGGLATPTPLVPAWTTWYLLSLFVWRMAAPWLTRVPHVLPLSVAVSIAAGGLAVIGPHLSLGRTLGFLPFFVLGLVWRDAWFARLRSPGIRVASAALFAGALALAYVTKPTLSRGVFFLHEDYGDLDFAFLEGAALRAAVLATGGLLTLALVSLTGWSSRVVARIGVGSLVVYLLHPFALYPTRVDGYSTALPEAAWLVLIAAATLVFAWLVSHRVVVRATKPLMDHRWWAGSRRS